MARLVLGTNINNTGTSSTVVEKPVPMPCSIQKTIDANGKLINSGETFIDLSGATSVGAYVLSNAFRNYQGITDVDMSSITSITEESACNSMFFGSSITSLNLSGLTIIGGSYAVDGICRDCRNLVSVNLENLTTTMATGTGTVFSTAFASCYKLENINLSSLRELNGSLANTFDYCESLKNISFPSLSIMPFFSSASYSCVFPRCHRLENVYFGALTSTTFASKLTQLRYMFDSETGKKSPNGCTVHFPSNFDPSDPDHTFDASTLAGYPTFNGKADYIHIAFDLPATE